MPIMLIFEAGTPFTGWRDALQKLSNAQRAIKRESSHPRKQNIAREKFADMVDVIHPLMIDEWVKSFPLNSHVPHFDCIDVANLLDRLRDNYEWANVTWDVVTAEMIQEMASRGIECPLGRVGGILFKDGSTKTTYYRWKQEVNRIASEEEIKDEDMDMPDWWKLYESGLYPQEAVKEAIDNP